MERGPSRAEPLQVTLVAHDVGPVGGMERQLSELVTGLLARGADVTVVSRTCELPRHPGLRWVRVPGPARPFVLAYPWFFLAGSLLVRRHRRGTLHTTGAIVWNRADVSTVHFCHHAAAARGLRRERRPGLGFRLNALLGGPLSRLGERIVYRPSRTRTLVAVSNGLAGELAAAFPRADVRTVANGVDVDRFRPDPEARGAARAELGVGEDELVALFVGGEWRAKGLAVAVEAVGRAEGWRLAVVGKGDAGPYRRSRATFLGERRDPERLYAAADAFLLPSAYETFSLAAHEAAASGVPVIGSAVHGLDELVVEGESGWLVERDASAIAERLSVLRASPDLRARMGAAARVASLRFGWPAMVDRYLALYASSNGRSA